MADSFLDLLPANEQQKLRKRMRSEAEYQKLREKVKGPEDLEREMDRNESLAEARFAMETDPAQHESVRKQAESDIREKGIEHVLESEGLSPEHKRSMEQGKFRMTVSNHPKTHQDRMMAVPEGTVQEKIPVKATFEEKYVTQLLQKAGGDKKAAASKKRKRKGS